MVCHKQWSYLDLQVIGLSMLACLFAVVVSLSTGANTLTDDEKADGWRLVWDGKTFDGWVAVKSGLAAPPEKGWVIEDGTLSMRPVNGISSDGRRFPLSPFSKCPMYPKRFL